MKTLLTVTLWLHCCLLWCRPNQDAGQRDLSYRPSDGQPEEVGMSSERLARIRARMKRYIDRKEVPGVVTMVARRGRVVHLEAAGYRDAEARRR